MTREEAIRVLEDNRPSVIFEDKDAQKRTAELCKAIDMAIEALSAEADGEDLIIKGAKGIKDGLYNIKDGKLFQFKAKGGTVRTYPIVSSADAVQGWIPCSERLPDELAAVNITWVNHNPPPYYKYTKDVPLVDSAVYYRGKWYWWDATVIDLLGEYDGAYIHGIEPIDKDIEVTAWMPLPKPYWWINR